MATYKKTKIEVPDYNDSYVRFVFGGAQYQLRFSWNDTEARWYFGVYTSTREPLLQGVKIVPNYALNLFSGRDDLYGGFFLAKTDLAAIGREDFKAGNATFLYVEQI